MINKDLTATGKLLCSTPLTSKKNYSHVVIVAAVSFGIWHGCCKYENPISIGLQGSILSDTLAGANTWRIRVSSALFVAIFSCSFNIRISIRINTETYSRNKLDFARYFLGH